jgi:hypothetical protein
MTKAATAVTTPASHPNIVSSLFLGAEDVSGRPSRAEQFMVALSRPTKLQLPFNSPSQSDAKSWHCAILKKDLWQYWRQEQVAVALQ